MPKTTLEYGSGTDAFGTHYKHWEKRARKGDLLIMADRQFDQTTHKFLSPSQKFEGILTPEGKKASVDLHSQLNISEKHKDSVAMVSMIAPKIDVEKNSMDRIILKDVFGDPSSGLSITSRHLGKTNDYNEFVQNLIDTLRPGGELIIAEWNSPQFAGLDELKAKLENKGLKAQIRFPGRLNALLERMGRPQYRKSIYDNCRFLIARKPK